MFWSVRRLKKWKESIKMKMFLSADILLWQLVCIKEKLVMKDSEWHSERSDKHGSLFTINTGKFPLQHEPDQPLWLVSCLPSSELQLSHHLNSFRKSRASLPLPTRAQAKTEAEINVWNNLSRQTCGTPAGTAESQERSKLTAEGTVWVKDVTGWLQWLATQWRAAAVLGLNSWNRWK